MALQKEKIPCILQLISLKPKLGELSASYVKNVYSVKRYCIESDQICSFFPLNQTSTREDGIIFFSEEKLIIIKNSTSYERNSKAIAVAKFKPRSKWFGQ